MNYILNYKYEGHLESKVRLHIQSARLFCCGWSLVSVVQCDVESCLMQLFVRPCQVISAEMAVHPPYSPDLAQSDFFPVSKNRASCW